MLACRSYRARRKYSRKLSLRFMGGGISPGDALQGGLPPACRGTGPWKGSDPTAAVSCYGLNEKPMSPTRRENSPPGAVTTKGHDSDVSLPSLSRITTDGW